MEDTFEFRKARIVGGDEGADVRVMGGFDGLREEGTRNLLGDEGREEGLGEFSDVGVEVIWMTADTPPPDGQRVGNGAFGG
jgi:hypothetical protein